MMQWLQQYGQIATFLFTAVVTVATAVYAVLTWQLVTETRRMREAQTDPHVVVYFEPLEELLLLGRLRVKNIGLGAAYDITFSLRPEGAHAGAQRLLDDFTKTKFLVRGVGFLGPNQELQSGYTKFNEGYEEKIRAVLVVNLRYRSVTGRWREEQCRIDFSEIEGTTRIGTPPLYSLAQSLEKLQADVHRIASGYSRIQVDSHSTDDRAREREEMLAPIEEHRADLAADQSDGAKPDS